MLKKTHASAGGCTRQSHEGKSQGVHRDSNTRGAAGGKPDQSQRTSSSARVPRETRARGRRELMVTLTSPTLLMRMFSGLMSRWMRCSECRWSSPCSVCLIHGGRPLELTKKKRKRKWWRWESNSGGCDHANPAQKAAKKKGKEVEAAGVELRTASTRSTGTDLSRDVAHDALLERPALLHRREQRPAVHVLQTARAQQTQPISNEREADWLNIESEVGRFANEGRCTVASTGNNTQWQAEEVQTQSSSARETNWSSSNNKLCRK